MKFCYFNYSSVYRTEHATNSKQLFPRVFTLFIVSVLEAYIFYSKMVKRIVGDIV